MSRFPRMLIRWRFAAGLCVLASIATGVCANDPARAATRQPRAGDRCKESELGTTVKTDRDRLVCLRNGKRIVWTRAVVTPTSVGSPPSIGSGAGTVLYREDFSALNSGWANVTTEAGSVGYRDEKFRITVTAPNTTMGARAPITDALANISVEVDERTVSTTGQVSLGCHDTGPIAAATRYDGTIGREDRWSIGEVRNGVRTILATGELQLGLQFTGERLNHLTFVCVGSPGSAGRLRLSLNGRTVGEVTVASMLPAGGVSLWASSYATPTINGTTSVETIWNNLAVAQLS